MGAGKAIISTPYWHAAELLDDGRGTLVPFEDPAAIAAAAIGLLDNDAERHAMRKRAYLYAREMVWNRVAQSYMRSFSRAHARSMQPAHLKFPAEAVERSLPASF
jgi:glycosyltransferase involved in cell wall biosynthesis